VDPHQETEPGPLLAVERPAMAVAEQVAAVPGLGKKFLVGFLEISNMREHVGGHMEYQETGK